MSIYFRALTRFKVTLIYKLPSSDFTEEVLRTNVGNERNELCLSFSKRKTVVAMKLPLGEEAHVPLCQE
jgi:hypothetical protein